MLFRLFALAVASGDAKTLSRAPGLGMKTAQRIILELKDKISKEQAAAGISMPEIPMAASSSNAGEAINALVVLGYTQSEAASVVTKLDPELSVEDMIKKGLQKLAGLS